MTLERMLTAWETLGIEQRDALVKCAEAMLHPTMKATVVSPPPVKLIRDLSPHCPECGEALSRETKFCPTCGCMQAGPVVREQLQQRVQKVNQKVTVESLKATRKGPPFRPQAPGFPAFQLPPEEELEDY